MVDILTDGVNDITIVDRAATVAEGAAFDRNTHPAPWGTSPRCYGRSAAAIIHAA
jgi:hypothetical protein